MAERRVNARGRQRWPSSSWISTDSTRRRLRPASTRSSTSHEDSRDPRMTDFTASRTRSARCRSRRPRGPTATPARASRSSPSPGGHATRREDRRRSDRQPLHRLRADRGAPHPLGPGRQLRRPRRVRRRPGHRHRLHQPQHLPGRGLPARQRLQPRSARSAARPPTTCWSASRSRSRPARRSSPVVRRRHQLRRPGLDPRAPGPPRRGARRDLCGDARRVHDADRVQVLRARLLLTSTCPTGARACCTASASATARRCSSTPVTTRRARTSR